MDMLQTVIRSSMLKARIALPVYSNTYPTPPDVVSWPIKYRMMSLAVTPLGNTPSTRTSKVFALYCNSV
jgi:hypothetical protein